MKALCLAALCAALLADSPTTLGTRSPGEARALQGVAPQGPAQSAAQIPPATAPPAAPECLVLKDGTPIKLELTRELSSADAHAGDQVDFQVVEDVKVGNCVVIPTGGIAWAKITLAQHKRRLGRGGKLNLAIDTVRLADGEKAPVRTIQEAKGAGHVEEMTGGIVVATIFFFPAAPLYLFVEGEDITIPEGTEATAYVNGDFRLDPARFAPETPESEAARKAAAEAQIKQRRDRYMTSFAVESTPGGAEIRVDGRLMGETPGTLQLRIGKHAFRLDKRGYEPWGDVVDVGSKTATKITVILHKK